MVARPVQLLGATGTIPRVHVSAIEGVEPPSVFVNLWEENLATHPDAMVHRQVEEGDGVPKPHGTECQKEQTAIVDLHERPVVDVATGGPPHLGLELEQISNRVGNANVRESQGVSIRCPPPTEAATLASPAVAKEMMARCSNLSSDKVQGR